MKNKKHLLCTITATLLMTASMSAQVGINNENPKATLDITSLTTDGSNAEGLLVPRMSAEELKTMTETSVNQDQNSMMVFVTGAFTDTANKVNEYEFVDGAGYYYFDYKSGANASRWRKVATSVGSSYTAGTGMFLDSNEFSRSGVQEVLTANKSANANIGQGSYGWRYIGLDQEHYGNVGKYSTDLSYAPKNTSELFDVHELKIDDGTGTGTIVPAMPFSAAYSTQGNPSLIAYENNMGATGDYSFVGGLMNAGAGDFSTTFGLANVNEGGAGVVLGALNRVQGAYSVAIGSLNDLTPDREAYVMGGQNVVSAVRSVVLGTSNGNTSQGAKAEVSGLQSVVIGRLNGNTANNGVAIGVLNEVKGNYAVALGNGLKSKSQSVVSVGSYNTIDANPEIVGTSIDTKRVFNVGNGTATESNGVVTENRSDSFTILRNGMTGIDIDNFETTYGSDAGKGHINGAKLQVNGLVQSRGINSQSPAAGTNTRVVVADANGVLKTKKAATINQFYAPSALLPTSNSNLPSYVTVSGDTFTVDLHTFYKNQFSTPVAKSNTSSSLETYQANELDYFVTYADQTVYTDIAISTDGKLTYKIAPSGTPSDNTYMNIVFKVK